MSTAGIVIFIALFVLVTVIGFIAANWRRGDLAQLDEWGLGGRRFGTIVTWFLLGGDLYTAYTLIAVPALVFGAGAIGFSRCLMRWWRSSSVLPRCRACGPLPTSTVM